MEKVKLNVQICRFITTKLKRIAIHFLIIIFTPFNSLIKRLHHPLSGCNSRYSTCANGKLRVRDIINSSPANQLSGTTGYSLQSHVIHHLH